MTAVNDHNQAKSKSYEDLPVNPFTALRVAYGMLLGVEDFQTLIGYSRGKGMLHNAWLHGCGVVWGYRVEREGDRTLRVKPGLALDGLGRELLLDADFCIDLDCWLQEKRDDLKVEDGRMCACLFAVFDTCPTAPVPALADPCDLSRKHNDYSRVVEGVRLELRPGRCPRRKSPGAYHRIRVLLGLDPDASGDAGKEALEVSLEVAGKPPSERAGALLAAFRRLAAKGVTDLEPATEDGDAYPWMFPVTEDEAGVALAEVCFTVHRGNRCVDIDDVKVDPTVRTALLPTSVIQELVCGPPPAALGEGSDPDAGGPRVIPGSLSWAASDTLIFRVTKALHPGSLIGNSILLTSLGEQGWVREDILNVTYENKTVRIVRQDRPAYLAIRLLVRGTGPTPVLGTDFVPLAGIVGGPPGTAQDGHDAVLTLSRRAAT